MRIFANFIQAYQEYAKFSEAPDKFHFWTAVSTVAGALRRKVWIEMGYFQWIPNFYIIFVAPPGIVSKSTTVSIGMDILRGVKGIKFGPDAITYPSLTQSLANSVESFIDPGGHFLKMSAITIESSELGNLLNPSDREMIDALVSLWDGKRGTWSKSTKTCGSDTIYNPWINIIGCTTPAWIAGYFPQYLIGGGFTSRTVFVHAETKRRLISYPKREMPKEHEELRVKLISDLTQIAGMAGEYHISPEAYEWGDDWYRKVHTCRPSHLIGAQFDAYIARKQTLLHKLAMILAASESDQLLITKDHLFIADNILYGVEMDIPKIFKNIGQDNVTRKVNEAIKIVQEHGELTQRDFLKIIINKMSVRQAEEAIEAGVKAGMLNLSMRGTQMFITAPEVPQSPHSSGEEKPCLYHGKLESVPEPPALPPQSGQLPSGENGTS